MAQQTEIVLILDNIRSLYNVGSMFRTADGFGVRKIYLCGITGTPLQRGLQKVALGAEESVLWEHAAQTWRVIEQLRSEGYSIVGMEKSGRSQDLADFPVPKRVALVVGNEVRGISDALLRRMDHIVHVPMRGTKGSFNVAVVAGIGLYHLRLTSYPSQKS